jgi:undecaprenyl-diphosphatase
MSEIDHLPKPRRIALPAAGFALAWFTMLTVGSGAADGHILHLFYAGDHPLLAAVARSLTMMGEGPVLILAAAVAAAILLWQGHPRRGFSVLAVSLVGRLLVDAQKYAILRFRPENEIHLVPVSSPSFPSAHAANSTILALTLALVFFGTGRFRGVAVALALAFGFLVGLSRVVLGVHWPSDVVGGWAFALLWVLLTLPLAERLFDSRR